MTNNLLRKFHDLKTFRPIEVVFYLAFGAFALRLAVRCFQNIARLDLQTFADQTLWGPLLIVLSTHGIFLIFAAVLARIFDKINVLVFYGVIVLSFPFLWVLNALTMRIPDGIFLWSVFAIWLAVSVGCLIKRNISWSQPNFASVFKPENLLLGLWLIHALTLFLNFNFSRERKPFGDESTLWFTAAQRMMDSGFMHAHATGYSGRGIQPLGVPFVASLPAKFFAITDQAIIFFMPLIIIMGLFMFLNQIKSRRFLFLFFLVSSFATFHNRSWLSELCYRLVYGEGISMLLFLIVSWQIWTWVESKSVSRAGYLWVCLLSGMFALVKWPLAVMPAGFYVVATAVYLYVHPTDRYRHVLVLVIALGLTFAPQLFWSLFNQIHGFAIPPEVTANMQQLLGRLSAPNWEGLKQILVDMFHQYDSLSYYMIFAFVLCAAFLRRIELLAMVPVMMLLMFVVFYYAYFFIYQQEGDWGSALRYGMPLVLTLYALGGIGFDRLMQLAHDDKRPISLRWTLTFVPMTLLLIKLF